MEKLELKHIIGYSNYGLRGYFLGKLDIVTEIDFVHGLVSSLNNGTVQLKDFKPALHPLTDLMKDIEVNGEKFNPIVRLNELLPEDMKKDSVAVCDNGIDLYYWDEYSYLFEWHFDIFGLIEKGLAIDINTL